MIIICCKQRNYTLKWRNIKCSFIWLMMTVMPSLRTMCFNGFGFRFLPSSQTKWMNFYRICSLFHWNCMCCLYILLYITMTVHCFNEPFKDIVCTVHVVLLFSFYNPLNWRPQKYNKSAGEKLEMFKQKSTQTHNNRK